MNEILPQNIGYLFIIDVENVCNKILYNKTPQNIFKHANVGHKPMKITCKNVVCFVFQEIQISTKKKSYYQLKK